MGLVAVLLWALPLRAERHVELLTMLPGPELWERFGHTALRVHDDSQDVVFSFGAAPFRDPAFVWAFARGDADFNVAVQGFDQMLRYYRACDRTVQSQDLLLPEGEQQEIVFALLRAATPPNNRYRYDQLYDNCATRIRDLLDRVSHGALRRAAARRHPGRRFRDYTLEAMAGHPIGHWALDLLGGPHQDRSVDGYQEMFLPVHLRDRVAEAQWVEAGEARPLAAPIRTLIQRQGPPLSQEVWAARSAMLRWGLTLLGLTLLAAGVGPRSPLMRRVAAALALVFSLWSAAFGLLVGPLALLSRVHNFSPNENAWLFLPLDLLCVVPFARCAGFGREAPRWLSVYLGLRALGWIVLLALKLAGLCTQDNWVFVALSGFYLLCAAAATRAFSPDTRRSVAL